jgi:hypothetical protein
MKNPTSPTGVSRIIMNSALQMALFIAGVFALVTGIAWIAEMVIPYVLFTRMP